MCFQNGVCLFRCEEGNFLDTTVNLVRLWSEGKGHLSVIFPILDKRCILIRVRRMQDHIFTDNFYGDERQCHLNLSPDKVTSPHTTLQLSARYFLKHSSNIQEKLSISTFSNNLDNLTARQDVSNSYTMERWTSNKTQETKREVENSRNIAGLFVSECFSSDHSLYKSNVSFDSWQGWSFSWVDIIFQVKQNTTEPKAIFLKEHIKYQSIAWPSNSEGWYQNINNILKQKGMVNLFPGQFVQDSFDISFDRA